METSSLREVFGSTLSLSELSGDTEASSQQPADGYSRFGLNEHRPAHQMHTRVRRFSNDTAPPTPAGLAGGGLHSAAPRPVWVRLPALAACGLAHSLLMHCHVPPTVDLSGRPAPLLISAALAVVAGMLMPLTDPRGSAGRLGYSAAAQAATNTSTTTTTTTTHAPAVSSTSTSSAASAAASKRELGSKQPQRPATHHPESRPCSFGPTVSPAQQQQQQQQRPWGSALLRLYGILLGLVYFASKLPRDATSAWLLIAPCMWYVSDTSFRGLLAALVLAVVGGVATILQLPPNSDLALSGCGSAAAYFGTVLVFAEIGRALTAPPASALPRI